MNERVFRSDRSSRKVAKASSGIANADVEGTRDEEEDAAVQ